MAAKRKYIREESKSAGYPSRQLPEKAQAGVDVGPLPHRRDEESARQGRLARILGLENRAIAPVPASREVKPSLLYPPLPVGAAQAVGDPHDWMIGGEYSNGSVLVSDAVMTDRRSRPRRSVARRATRRAFVQPQRLPTDLHRVGSKPPVEILMLLVLHDDEAATPGLLQETPVVRD
jgi:hypothetical protein